MNAREKLSSFHKDMMYTLRQLAHAEHVSFQGVERGKMYRVVYIFSCLPAATILKVKINRVKPGLAVIRPLV